MIKTKELLKIKQGDLAVRTELLKKYPVQELIDDLCEIIAQGEKTTQTERILITQEQFNTMFKIKGIALDGISCERRGRPRKNEGEIKQD